MAKIKKTESASYWKSCSTKVSCIPIEYIVVEPLLKEFRKFL